MGKKQKKKAPQNKKTSERNSGSRRDNWLFDGSKYSNSESPHIEDDQEKELSSTNFRSSSDIFLYSCNIEDNECDSETTKFCLMGESDKNIKAEVKRLTDKIRDQQDLFDKRECTLKEEVTRLKDQLEEKQSKEAVQGKVRSISKVASEVTSFRNEVSENDTTTKEII